MSFSIDEYAATLCRDATIRRVSVRVTRYRSMMLIAADYKRY